MEHANHTLTVIDPCRTAHANGEHVHQRRRVSRRTLSALLLSSLLWMGPRLTQADSGPLDCSKKSLSDAINKADDAAPTIVFTGVCAGPVVIRKDGLTLQGVGTAVIEGGSQAAVTITGVHGVALANLEVRKGLNGIVGANGAHLSLTDVNVHDNTVFGISLQTASSAVLTNVTTTKNGVHGLDVQTGSAATVTKSFTTVNNRVFGINVNGSAMTFAQATVTATGNALGIQIATNANAFLNDPTTIINVNNNLATGLTVVSGAHLVSFGGTINASGNGLNGVSVNAKGGLDLDAGSQLNSFNNGEGVLLQEGSTMTVFNIPQFSGVSGTSTINTHNNTGNGMTVRNGAVLTFSNAAKIDSEQNGAVGLAVDNGSNVTLVSSTSVTSILTGNTGKDLSLTFGTRADIQTVTLGTYACDTTVLVRGASGITCPH